MSLKQITIAMLSFIALLGLMFGLIYFFSDIERLKNVSAEGIILLVLLGLVYKLLQGLILRCSLLLFGIRTKFKEWMGLLFLTLFGNFLIPASGLGFRAFYLKKKYDLSIVQFIASLGVVYLIELVFYALMGMAGLWYLHVHRNVHNEALLWIFAIMSIGPLFLPLLASKIAGTFTFLPEKIKSALNGLSLMGAHKALTFQIAAYTLAQTFVFNAIFWVCYREIQVSVPYWELFVVSSLADFAFFFRILPAALGSYEGFIWFGNRALGLTQENAFLVIALSRTVIFLLVLIFAPIFSFWLMRKTPSERPSNAIDDPHEDMTR